MLTASLFLTHFLSRIVARLDVETILPASLGAEDRAELLRRGLESVQGTLQPVAETSYVISSVLVEKMVAEAARIGKSAKPVAAPGAQAGGKGGPGAQTKKGIAEESARVEEDDDDDDDWGKGSGKRGKKGKKGGARGAKAAPKAASSKAAKPAREPESQTPPELEPEALARAVAGIPEADAVDLASEPALLESLTPALRAAALAAFAEAERARRASGRDRLHSLRGRYSQAAQSAFEELCECDAARAALYAGDEAVSDAVERHLLRTLGLAALDALLRFGGAEELEEEALAAEVTAAA